MTHGSKGDGGAQVETKRIDSDSGDAGADVFEEWRRSIIDGVAPMIYPVGEGELGRFEIGPGMITLVGGEPGAGKTALVMQLTFEALRLTPAIKALVCNVEMSPLSLLDRQLARLSGLDGQAIRRRAFDPTGPSVVRAMTQIRVLGERLRFTPQHSDIEDIARQAEAFDAGIVVVDYIQRIDSGTAERKTAVDAIMRRLRGLASQGRAVIAVSAVSRARDRNGNPCYADSAGLASFRETSELEYGADNAYLLLAGDPATGRPMTLRHLKSRHGEPSDIRLAFDGSRQRFDSAPARSAPIAPTASPTKPASDRRATAEERSRRAHAGATR